MTIGWRRVFLLLWRVSVTFVALLLLLKWYSKEKYDEKQSLLRVKGGKEEGNLYESYSKDA